MYLASGSNGDPVTDGKMIQAAEVFQGVDTKPVTVLVDGGWTTPAYQKKLVEIAETRQDCVAILSMPYEADSSFDYVNAVVDYRQNQQLINSSYAALYSPHVRVYDKFNDRNIWISPDGYVAQSIANTAYNYELWFPVAGYNRGVISALDTRVRISSASGVADYLYDNGINPICFEKDKGIVIFGQKTLLAAPSDLDRLNARLCLIVIKPAIRDALKQFLFELNDEATRNRMLDVVASYMDGIKARRGVYDYYCVCDETNNLPTDIENNICRFDLFVKIVKSIEFIKFRTVVTPYGMSFGDAQVAL
jgi:phage tail sheath protein FI